MGLFDRYKNDRAFEAFRLLQIVFVVGPILAGLDKFFYMLTNWSNYLSPMVMTIISNHDRGFMAVVGIIEILVGIFMIFRPKIFSWVIAVMLFLMIINLLCTGMFFDVALWDVGMLLSAIAFARLSPNYDKS